MIRKNSSSNTLLSRYETEAILNQYLLFHYGSDHDQLPFQFGPQNSLHFPIRCVAECLDVDSLPLHAKAVDLGCAVGGSSFELAKYCEQVVAIDNSHTFISAAQHIKYHGQLEYTLIEEGTRTVRRLAKRPKHIDFERIEFRCCDAMDLFQKPTPFDVILAANLLCRLPDPSTFLKLLPTLSAKGGQLILISPYSWLDEFTLRDNWLGAGSSSQNNLLESINELFEGCFQLVRYFDIPFLIREHLRKYEWGISQASIWKRK